MLLLSLSSCSLADDVNDRKCMEGKKSCVDCYSLLVSQVTDRDENLFRLQNTFFPPEKAPPLFVTVYYRYGNRSYDCDPNIDAKHNTTQVWFWSTTLFYMFQPIHVFQYTSLLFSDFAHSYSATVCLILDPECHGANKTHMKLLTQRVSFIIELAKFNTRVQGS